MQKKGLSQIPDPNELHQGPDPGQETEQGIECEGGMPDRFGKETPDSGHKQPAEKDQGYGDFVSVKLGEKFTDRQKLDRDGGNTGSNDGRYEEVFQYVSTRKIRRRFYSSKAWT